MKKIIRTAILALLVTAGITLSAQAAPLFSPQKAYNNQFVDVSTSDWFYNNVASLYSLGLTNGKGDTEHFAPASNMTVAEVITMAARLRSLHDFGGSEVGASFFWTEGASWYAPYVAYLKYCGVIGSELDARMNLPATRAEVAHVLANALPAELFEDINADAVTVGYATGSYIRDVNDYTPYREDILSLYRRGILNGADSTGSFFPDSAILRSEAAAVVTRIVDPDLRITLQWVIHEETPVSSLSELVSSDGSFFTAPDPNNQAAIDANIRYMLSRGERTMTLDYGSPLPEQEISAIMDAFLNAVRRYPEQTYNQIHVSYSRFHGRISIRFSSSLYADHLLDLYRNKILTDALRVRDELYTSGKLNFGMSQYQKAKVYFDWLCDYCEYDYDCGATDLSHSAYNVFENRKAVCDGYTAAYNLLLRLEGIECYAIDLDEWDHMWTIAVLDGTDYHIDVTWGDQTNTPIDRYFAMTEEDSLSRFN